MKKISAISPGINNAMIASQDSGGDSATALFEQAFSDMAYQSLQGKMPELMQSVVTFRILLSSTEKGHAVGSFVVAKKEQILYIPAVLIDNAIKPLDIMYSKDIGKFLPLTDNWLAEVDKLNEVTLGQATKRPPTVPSDVSIRDYVLPPYAGRYGYSSIFEDMLDSPDTLQDIKTAAVKLLNKAPVGFGEKFIRSLLVNEKVAETYLNHFDGPEKLAAYFCSQEAEELKKEAEAAFVVVKSDSELNKFAEVFEDTAVEAYQEALTKGYSYKIAADFRLHSTVLKDNVTDPVKKDLKVEEPVQHFVHLEDPVTTGFHKLYKLDGSIVEALVVSKHGHFKKRVVDFVDYTVIMSDGSFARCSNLCGTPLTDSEILESKIYNKIKESIKPTVVRGKGIFIRAKKPGHIETYGPFEIDNITEKDNEIRARTWDDKILIISDSKVGNVIRFKDSDFIYIPADYAFLPLKNEKEVDFLSKPNDVYLSISKSITKVAENTVVIKHAEGSFKVNRNDFSDRADSFANLVGYYRIEPKIAEQLLDDAETGEIVKAHVLSDRSLRKLSSIFDPVENIPPDMMEAIPQVDPNTGMPIDPSMGGMPQIDPNTGMPIDPSMGGMPQIDPNTGMPIDPNTGMPIDPSMQPTGMATGEQLEQPELNPAFADNPALLQDPELMDMATFDVIVRSPTLKDIVAEYSGTLLKALDRVGRILLGIYVKSPELKKEIGNTQYSALELGVRNLFKSFGETLIDMHQDSAILGQAVQADYEEE